ncbi:uncharacterized protein [Apostichopus japonicus]|uniref:uncharacterized protein n=1 Tax=Stichopus japonicus TaxID=307972 RepID=UPI003AB1C5D3
MPKCQVYGCPNQPGACNSIDGKKRSFFMIPDGQKNPQLCSIWIRSLGPTKYHPNTFRSNKCRTVCEEHFTPDCFQEDKYAKLLGYIPNRKLLKPGAYPTLVGEKAYATRLKRLHAKERKRQELEAKQLATTCHAVCSMDSCQDDCSCCWTEVNELPVLLKETQVTGAIEDHNYCFPRKIEPEDAYRRIEVGLTEEQMRHQSLVSNHLQQMDMNEEVASRPDASEVLTTMQSLTRGVAFPVQIGRSAIGSDSVVADEEITIGLEPLADVSSSPERLPPSGHPGPTLETRYIMVDHGTTSYGDHFASTRKKEPDEEVIVKLEVFEFEPNSDETILEFKASVDLDELNAGV